MSKESRKQKISKYCIRTKIDIIRRDSEILSRRIDKIKEERSRLNKEKKFLKGLLAATATLELGESK